jgi:hypothetical protein
VHVANTTPAVAQPIAPTLQSAETAQQGKLEPPLEESLAYLNDHFIQENVFTDTDSPVISWNNRLEISTANPPERRLVLSADYRERLEDGRQQNSHGVESVRIADLDAASLDTIHGPDRVTLTIGCTGSINCIANSDNGKVGVQFTMDIGPFPIKADKEVAAYLKRVILLSQGKPAPPVTRQATEEEALAFIKAHLASTYHVGGNITAVNRSVSVVGDNLIETEPLTAADGETGYFVVTWPLKELEASDVMPMPYGTEVSIACNCLVPCIRTNRGNLEAGTMHGVSNSQEVAQMLKRVIRLHGGGGACVPKQ